MFTLKQKTPKAKCSLRGSLCAIGIICSTLILSGCFQKKFTWAPWTDLSDYYNLESIERMDGDICKFNSYTYSQGKLTYASRHIDDREYNAIVLGTSVWIRSQPAISPYTAKCQVQTGDKLTVLHSAGYINGKYWSYVYINSGYNAGYNGYVCTDYIVEQNRYEMLQNYVFGANSGLSLQTESKYLHAIADILIKFNANKYHPNLSVSLIDTTPTGEHIIATYRIRNYDIGENNSMLAVVQFFPDNNDFVVLGIVPGSGLRDINKRFDGSHDVYFY